MARKIMAAAAAVAVIAALALPAAAQDKQAYQEALVNFAQKAASKDPADRASAAEGLGEATFPDVDKKTVSLIVDLLAKELAKSGGKGGKREEQVHGDVVEACLGALKKIRDPKAIDLLLRVATKRGGDNRLRFYVISALGTSGNEDVHKELVKLADDKDPLVQIAAMDALAEEGSPDSLQLFITVIGDTKRSWEVKLSAIQGLEKTATAKDEKVIEPLIEALGKLSDDQGRVKVDLIRVLNKLMGTDIKTDDPGFWKFAWNKIKEGKKPGEDGGTTVEPTEFFGLKSKSTRIVFVLDRTGSMQDPGSEPKKNPKEPPKGDDTETGRNGKPDPAQQAAKAEAKKKKEEYDKRPVATKMDALKKEYINAVYNLDKRVHFTTIWYEGNATAWKDQLVPATWKNKLDAIKYADKINPSGPTNLWDAIEMAFKMVASPRRPDVVKVDKNGNYATVVNGPDTFFVMTDGVPNSGRIPEPTAILAELRKVNRVRKVIVHTICLGDTGVGSSPPDPAFLKKMADENGGQFAHITGK